MNDLFLRACLGQAVERTPVWMMRQAGRYLPEYRAVRKNHDFITMYKTPELAAEVTIQPVDIVGVDAAILFSDILVVPEVMGLDLKFLEGRGPVFSNPVQTEKDIEKLRKIDANDDLHYVITAIKMLRKELDGRVPLIGFSGAPWTLATYMIEGQSSKNYAKIKQWRFGNPAALHKVMEKTTTAVIDYMNAQLDAGAQAIQLFDSWAGILDPEGFEEFALKYVRQIIREVKRPGVPFIYFAKGAGIWLEQMKSIGADVIGLDWTIDIGRAKDILGDSVAVQGNMDPTALFAEPKFIREQVKKILQKVDGRPGHVFNLGHGILPTVPVPHARAFVDAVKELSAK